MNGTERGGGAPVLKFGSRFGGPRFSFLNPEASTSPNQHSIQHRPRYGYQPYRPHPRPARSGKATSDQNNPDFDARQLRKSLVRKTVDYNAAIIKSLQVT